MYKALALYLIVLGALGIAVCWSPLAWLTPVSLLALLAGSIWLWRAEGHSIAELGLQRPALWRRKIAWGLLIGLSLPVVLIAVQVGGGWITLTPAFGTAGNSLRVVLLAVGKTALIAVVEELIFRGYFLQRFTLNLGVRLAVLLSSLLWAIMHLPNMLTSGLHPLQLAVGTVTFSLIGAALGIGFLYNNKTLWLPFGLHCGYNVSYSLIGGLTAVTYHAPTWWAGHPAWPPESGLSGLLLAGVILGIVWWRRENKSLG